MKTQKKYPPFEVNLPINVIFRGLIFAFLCLFPFFSTLAQPRSDIQLANFYYDNGELDKAKDYFEKIYKRNPSDSYFDRYLDCVMSEKDVKTAEKMLKKHQQISYDKVKYGTKLAKLYEENNDQTKADKTYQTLCKEMLDSENARDVSTLFRFLLQNNKTDMAWQLITKARKNNNMNWYPFHFEFAEYYKYTKQVKKMFSEYIDLCEQKDAYFSSVKMRMEHLVDFSDTSSEYYQVLRTELLSRVQKNPDNIQLTELMIWVFVQSKDFEAARLQTQSFDKRLNLKGQKVYDIGVICVNNREYKSARKAFEYVKKQGETAPYYYHAEMGLLNTYYREITTERTSSSEEIKQAIEQYEATLKRIGFTNRSLPLIVELAEIEAYYNQHAQRAIDLLNRAVKLERLTDIQRAEVKTKLADIQVVHGDIWEAALLYMQVDKDFKFEPIGQEARFKNARIFYYNGEFNFAQSQLDVLKQGTSKLISNDAIQLSLLITDNLGLDSNYTAMSWFAQADLLIEQRKYDAAFQLFDSILTEFPYHSLGDEILLKKAQAMQQQGKWNQAIDYLDELIKYYPNDILADDAWFIKATIYEEHLSDKEKAMECYKVVLFQYPGSIHITEARKRFRALRGDDMTS